MEFRIKSLAGALALAVLATPTLMIEAAGAQERIGAVNYVRVWAYGGQGGTWKDLFTHDAVYAQQGVRTVSKGAAHVRFVDGTDLRVGSDSEVVLDEFVFTQAGGAGSFTANMTKGVLRLVTGKLAKPSYKVRTPTALIGVRGTDFVVTIGADGSTAVEVIDGEVEISPAAGGDASAVAAGSTGRVGQGATQVAVTRGIRPPGEGIEDGAELQGETGQDAADDGDGHN